MSWEKTADVMPEMLKLPDNARTYALHLRQRVEQHRVNTAQLPVDISYRTLILEINRVTDTADYGTRTCLADEIRRQA